MRFSRISRGFSGLSVLLGGVVVLGALGGLAGCPDTELKACYATDECAGGQVCTVDGRCVTLGGTADAGLDAGLDGGTRDAATDGRVGDRGPAVDMALGDAQADTGTDAAVTDADLPDRGEGDQSVPDMTPPPELDLRHCRVVEGAAMPALRLASQPTGFDLLRTGPDRVVRLVATAPIYNEDFTELLAAGTVGLHCASPKLLDQPGADSAIDLGTNTGLDGGRPMVRMLLAGGRLHVAWWYFGERTPEYQAQSVRGVSLGLDADGCPLASDRVSWEQAAHPYAPEFDLAWLDGRLHVVLGRPPEMAAFASNWMLPAIAEAQNDGASTFSAVANHLAVVSRPEGDLVDVFASATPVSDELLLHGRMAYNETFLAPVNPRGAFGAEDLGPFRLIEAEAGPAGRIGVLSQALPGPEEQPCGIGGFDGPDTNGEPARLVLQLVEPGRADGEVVYQVEATPVGATGNPLFADLTWHPELNHFAVAFSSIHGTQGAPDDSGIRLAIIRPEDGQIPTVDGRFMHLEIAHYDKTCQTVVHRPRVVPTAEGFLVIWFHRYDWLRQARVVCTPPAP